MDCIKLYDIGLSPQYHPQELNTNYPQKKDRDKNMERLVE
jgi:hypothetical protein